MNGVKSGPPNSEEVEEYMAVFNFPKWNKNRATAILCCVAAASSAVVEVGSRFLGHDFGRSGLVWFLGPILTGVICGLAWNFLRGSDPWIILTPERISWRKNPPYENSIDLPLTDLEIKPIRPKVGLPYYSISSRSQEGRTISIAANLGRFEEFRAMLANFTGQTIPPLR